MRFTSHKSGCCKQPKPNRLSPGEISSADRHAVSHTPSSFCEAVPSTPRQTPNQRGARTETVLRPALMELLAGADYALLSSRKIEGYPID